MQLKIKKTDKDIQTTPYIKRPVETWLNMVDYEFKGYMPKEAALKFVNFINQVNGGAEENETPLVHLVMMDNVFNNERRCAVLCHRGIGKTSLFAEYLFLFIGAFGYMPGFGNVDLALYVTDSVENGVKNLRRNIEYRFEESPYLQQLIPNRKITTRDENDQSYSSDEYESARTSGVKFTDVRLEFINQAGHRFIAKLYGAKTGVRGAKELGKRPTLAVIDDVVSDTDAESATIINTIENTIYKAVSKALHPEKQKMIWLGTPYNARDPLYKAVESGAWNVSVYPICEKYPCAREDFKGSWEDRFSFDYVKREYEEAMALGKPENFNQELMLRIISAEDQLLQDDEIQWYRLKNLLINKYMFNYFITTDFATGEADANDLSVISVWALNSNGDWFWVDGICKQQTMDKNLDDLFRLATIWKANLMGVGIEVNGQQRGFISWIKERMMQRNMYFNLFSYNNGRKPGINNGNNKDKLARFNMVLPLFRAFKISFPLELKNTAPMIECINELLLVSAKGFKSKFDDFADTISMLVCLPDLRPSDPNEEEQHKNKNSMWYTDEDEDTISSIDSYIV